MKAKFVNESINWSEPDDEKFRESWINEIRNFSSTEEIDQHVFEMTCGHHFPFNPVEPLRSVYREKILELKMIEEKEQKKSLELQVLSSRKQQSVDDLNRIIAIFDGLDNQRQEILRSEDRMIFQRQRSLAIIIPQSFQANERECMPWQI